MNKHDLTPLLRPLSTDEYAPLARTETQSKAVDVARAQGEAAVSSLGATPRRYWASRCGTAAGLLAVNDAAGGCYFHLPAESAIDDDAAEEAFASDGPVIDVQTHWIADKPGLRDFQQLVLDGYRHQAPDWWTGLDGISAFTMAEYMRCVFVESETAVAVISSTPGSTDGDMLISNAEMAGMRELFDRLAGTGRLVNHTVVRPNVGDIDKMFEWADLYKPVGWKVYTLGMMRENYYGFEPGNEWRLDDEATGFPFLERVRETGVKVVCAHKGVSGLIASGSPSDVGPAAQAFPDINFLIYHSGYEPGMVIEGPYTEATRDDGVNRLIHSLKSNGIGPGGNVFAELGTTWFNLVSRPVEAAHVLGKLLLHVGEDNIIWGTDAIWYGPTQPVLDAFRAFQIPDSYCEQFGYPKLTPRAKRKILAGNAARVYGLDDSTVRTAGQDDKVLGWTRAVLAEYGRHGLVSTGD